MSPRTGRPTDNKKTERMEIRLTKDEASTLIECAEKLKASKAEVIVKGINAVKKELDEK